VTHVAPSLHSITTRFKELSVEGTARIRHDLFPAASDKYEEAGASTAPVFKETVPTPVSASIFFNYMLVIFF
jgi:hypothetical protein